MRGCDSTTQAWLQFGGILIPVILGLLYRRKQAPVAPSPERTLLMPEKLGIKELTEIVDAGLELQGLVSDVLADKKVDMADLPAVISRIPALAAKLPAAVEGAGGAIPELKDLDGEEAGILTSHVMAKLSIGDAKARMIVEKSLKLVIATVELIRATKAG